MAREEATKSSLVKLLQRISHGVAPRIGLVPTTVEKVPAMALIAAFERSDAAGLAAAAAAGADALAVPADKGLAQWEENAKAAGGKPLGLVLEEAATEDVKKYIERGPDFVIAAADGGPASLLRAGAVGRIVTLDESYPAQLVRALGEMPIDALLVEAAGDKAGPLTIRDLLHYRQAVDLVRRPVLVAAEGTALTELLSVLRDMGVEGLLLRFRAATKPEEAREQVGSYRKAIDELGRPIGRGRESERAPALPRAAAGGPTIAEEPEEEPDDE